MSGKDFLADLKAVTNLDFGTDLFIPGGYTSGGAPEIVIDALNIFQNPAVQSIEFIQNQGK